MVYPDPHRRALSPIAANIALKTRQALALEDILATALAELRQQLACDRCVIYRFNPDWSGFVTQESVADPRWSLRDHLIKDPCFSRSWVSPYREGRIHQNEDVENSGLRDCYRDFLAAFQIRANLVVPILLGGEGMAELGAEPLWGLLIAHHCQGPRSWSPEEVQLVKQLSDQMAIALQQSLLRQHVQSERAERQQIEASLRVSEARFRRLAEQAKDAIYHYRWEPFPQVEYINPAIMALTGYTPGEFYASPDLLFSLVHREDLAQFRQQLSSRDLPAQDLSVQDLSSQAGFPQAAIGTSEQSAAAKENSNPAYLSVTHLDLANPSLVDSSLANSSLANSSLANSSLAEAAETRALHGGPAQPMLTVLRWIHREGTVIWVEQRCTPLLDGNGQPIAMECMVRDIRDRLGEEIRSPAVSRPLVQGLRQAWGQVFSQSWLRRIDRLWSRWREPLSSLALSHWGSALVMVSMIVLAESLRQAGLSAASQMLALFVGLVLAASAGGLRSGLWATLALWLYLLATVLFGENVRNADWLLYLGLYVITTVTVAWVVGQTKDRSLLASQALNKVNDILELRVQERTATLDRTNRQLRQEIEERRRAQAAHQASEVELQQLNQELERRVLERTATLEASERRWRRFIDTVRLAVMGIDLDGKINYVNPHFLALTGYEVEAVLGRNWFETFVPRHRLAQTQQAFQDFWEEGSHAYFQTVILTQSGEERIVAWNNTLLRDVQGQIQGSLSIGEDMTERYAIARMKDEFISVVSHELRTPLTSIHGALELLSSAVVPLASEQGRHVLAIAAENSNRLVRLINDILQL